MTTINIASIARSAGTQFRAEVEKGSIEHGKREKNIEAMMDLIEREVPFKTPIRLARCNDTLYLVDGFHRLAAYTRLKIIDVPAANFSIVDASSIEEVRALAAGANVAHGKGNTEADYHNIIKRMMDLGSTYMKNTFEPDLKLIAEAIGAALPRLRSGYSDYIAPDATQTLSAQHKAARDAAVIAQHKEGMSERAIAKLFNMGKTTVHDIIEEVVGIAESVKPTTQAPAVLPMANTQDRSDTRVDADEFVDTFLEDYADFISLADDETETEPKPAFDLKAATGFGDDITHYTKREESAPWEPTDEELIAQYIAARDAVLARGLSLPK